MRTLVIERIEYLDEFLFNLATLHTKCLEPEPRNYEKYSDEKLLDILESFVLRYNMPRG